MHNISPLFRENMSTLVILNSSSDISSIWLTSEFGPVSCVCDTLLFPHFCAPYRFLTGCSPRGCRAVVTGGNHPSACSRRASSSTRWLEAGPVKGWWGAEPGRVRCSCCSIGITPAPPTSNSTSVPLLLAASCGVPVTVVVLFAVVFFNVPALILSLRSSSRTCGSKRVPTPLTLSSSSRLLLLAVWCLMTRCSLECDAISKCTHCITFYNPRHNKSNVFLFLDSRQDAGNTVGIPHSSH